MFCESELEMKGLTTGRVGSRKAGTLYLITHITGKLSLMGLCKIDQLHLDALMLNRRVLLSARISDVVACGEAASKGCAVAQYDLGLLYGDDEILCSESTLSAHWYRKSAEQGKSEAQSL